MTSPLTLPGNITIFGTPEIAALEQIKECMKHPKAVKGALMADNHLGYAMPIGGVVAYEDAVSPTGVGFDIGCGNMAVRTDLNLAHLGIGVDEGPEWEFANVKAIMREIQRKIAFGMGLSNNQIVDDPVMDDSSTWAEITKQFGPELREKARRQLGTVGSGNHYVDLLYDENGDIWVANHFGSRGLGHTIASGFFAAHAGLKFTDRVKESEGAVVFDTTTDFGQFYIAAMHLAGKYAYAGREFVIEQVLGILGANALDTVHNHHNFAWFEDGLWVVRKGATPLTAEPAFIGGSMGDISVIVRGTLDPKSDPTNIDVVTDLGNIGSAPHGAGRVMSRTAAAGKMRKMWTCNTRDCKWTGQAQQGNTRAYVVNGEVIPLEACPSCGNTKLKKARMRDTSTARIDWDATRADLTERGIVVLGAGADEAPGVYKDLATVLGAHPNIEVIRTLHPLGVVMAGPDDFDPYKD